jgi:hypothetical protein
MDKRSMHTNVPSVVSGILQVNQNRKDILVPGSKVLIKHFKHSIVFIIMIDLLLYMNLTHDFSCEGEVSISSVAINAAKNRRIVFSPLLLFHYEKNVKKVSLNVLFPYSGI